ncbi:hypothetical protein MMC18_001529 [Xylographa bjoerkii]|nr:hypothetical protein [Xylographa bjoerkii]
MPSQLPLYAYVVLFTTLALVLVPSISAAPVDINISANEVAAWFEGEWDSVDNSSFITNLMNETMTDIDQAWYAKAQCYALPTGVVAWISLLLTGWTIYCHTTDRKPLKFWSTKRLEHGVWGIILSVLTGAITIPLPAFTMYRCRGEWQLIAVSVYKMANVVALTFAGLHRSIEVCRKNKPREGKYGAPGVWIWFWMVVYTASFLAGNTGLLDIVKQLLHDSHQVFAILVACGSVAGVTVAIGAAYAIFDCLLAKHSHLLGAIGVVVGIILMCSGSLNEWTLAVIKNDLLGVPTGKSSIPYWLFFGGKRLLLLNW